MIFAAGFVLFVVSWFMAKVNPETEIERIARLIRESRGEFVMSFLSYRGIMGMIFILSLILMVTSIVIWSYHHLP